MGRFELKGPGTVTVFLLLDIFLGFCMVYKVISFLTLLDQLRVHRVPLLFGVPNKYRVCASEAPIL